MYAKEESPVNEMKGFTKNFQKRSKEKKSEDQEILDLLAHVKDEKVIFGTKVTFKSFKKNIVKKVFLSSNCETRVANLVKHYAKIVGCEVVELKINSDDIAQRLAKPFLISMVCVIKGGEK